jgi:hypothetical protein
VSVGGASVTPAPVAQAASALREAAAPLQPAPDTPAGRAAARAAAPLFSPLSSPLVSALAASTQALRGSQQVEASPVTASVSESSPSLARRSAPVAGVLAALTALAALGVAGAARSTGGVAACLDLARLSFPRFRILPCSTVDTPAAGALTSVGGAPTSRPELLSERDTKGAAGILPGLRIAPRIGGVLGNAVETSRPWRLLNTFFLALLLGANMLLIAVRSQIARIQSR